MEEYSAKQIGAMLASSNALSNLEAYVLGFMTRFVVKENVNELLQRIIALSQTASMENFDRFAKLLYNLGHIQDSEIDILTTYFEEIERSIKNDFNLLSKVQLFYFGRFHSLYNEADIHKQMKKANEQNETRRKNNDYPSEKEILKVIKKNLDEEVNNQPPSFRNLKKLNEVKTEPEQQDQNQSEPIVSNAQINMEVEIQNEGLDQKTVPEYIPAPIRRSPPPQVLGRVAKKSCKNPPKKPESPIQHQSVPNESSNFTNFQGHSMLAPTNSFSLGLLAETFKLNTQMQSKCNTNTNQFSQFFASNPLNKNVIKTTQPTIIDLEEEEEGEMIIFDQKTIKNEDTVVDQKDQEEIQQSDPIVPSSSLTKPMLIEDELIVVNKTPQQTPQKAQIDLIDKKESENIAKVALNALLSGKKRGSTHKNSDKSEKKSPERKTKKEKPQPQTQPQPQLQPKQNRFEQEEEEEEEEKTSQIILNPVNSDDIYDMSYYSSDDMSYMSSPRELDGPKELVLSYKSDNELEEDAELSFNGNINVFCQS